MPPPPILDLATYDLTTIVADKQTIESINPQRFEMQHLDAICHLDTEEHIVIGYKEVRDDEFWVRGHFPDYPLLPGVLMCEAAAQLVGYYCVTQKIIQSEIVGFGGMEDVRFRAPVRPGDRLIVVGQGKKLRKLRSVFAVQGFVGETMAFHGDIIGVPLSSE